MGRTSVEPTETPFATLDDGTRDGIRRGRAIGTYLHGALEVAAVLEELIGQTVHEPADGDHDAQYDRLAEWFATHVDEATFEREYVTRTTD